MYGFLLIFFYYIAQDHCSVHSVPRLQAVTTTIHAFHRSIWQQKNWRSLQQNVAVLKALKAEVYEKFLTAGLRCQVDVPCCLENRWSLVKLTPAFIDSSPG